MHLTPCGPPVCDLCMELRLRGKQIEKIIAAEPFNRTAVNELRLNPEKIAPIISGKNLPAAMSAQSGLLFQDLRPVTACKYRLPSAVGRYIFRIGAKLIYQLLPVQFFFCHVSFSFRFVILLWIARVYMTFSKKHHKKIAGKKFFHFFSENSEKAQKVFLESHIGM